MAKQNSPKATKTEHGLSNSDQLHANGSALQELSDEQLESVAGGCGPFRGGECNFSQHLFRPHMHGNRPPKGDMGGGTPPAPLDGGASSAS